MNGNPEMFDTTGARDVGNGGRLSWFDGNEITICTCAVVARDALTLVRLEAEQRLEQVVAKLRGHGSSLLLADRSRLCVLIRFCASAADDLQGDFFVREGIEAKPATR